MKIVISINTSWNIYNFRRSLVGYLIGKNAEVVTVAPHDAHSDRLRSLGARHIDFAMDNTGTNPLADMGLFARYLALLRRERPDVFLAWTVKPNIYGSAAAHVLGIPVINNVSGLGTAFVRDGWLRYIVSALYRVAFRRSHRVFFQNAADRDLFLERRLVRSNQTEILPGSGIDLTWFRPPELGSPVAGSKRQTVFLLVARLLWDKGVGEFVEAAWQVRTRYPDTRFCMLGFLDSGNRGAIPAGTVEAWVGEGVVEYLGATDDVRPFLAAADCVVLPSYYPEGTPRSLLEAAAMGRPLIATDAPGCRDVVEDGVNGFRCAVRDPGSLAAAMTRFLDLDPEARAAMGRASRVLAERDYDEALVIDAYRRALDAIARTRPVPA